MSGTTAAWGQIILATAFMAVVVGLRIWAARKYGKVRERIDNSEFGEAYNALSTAGDTAFLLLIIVLVWVATGAWSRL